MPPLPLPPLYATYLRHLLHLRLIALAGQALAYAYAVTQGHLAVPVLPLAGLGTVLLLYTLWLLRQLPRRGDLGPSALLLQTGVDLASLTAALAMAGGGTNPLVSLLLLPVTVATATLPPSLSWWVAGSAAACYTLLMFVPQPVAMAHHGPGAVWLHIWGMWYGFLLSALLVTLFVARIGATLRDHDLALAAARERAARDEQALALGILAAGTAHELGTPLSTVAVIAADLADEWRSAPELAERLGVLRAQVQRCKDILGQMAVEAGEPRADCGRAMALDDYLSGLISDWQGSRPGLEIESSWAGTGPAPHIVAERSLTQAIQNLLNNAADASPSGLAASALWSPDRVEIEVRDQGAGLSPSIVSRVGEPLGPGQEGAGGMGLGLCLTKTVIERLGGRIELLPHPPGGVLARIHLPLAQLLATGDDMGRAQVVR
jgi:two-component system sensor histidine kinase RegB